MPEIKLQKRYKYAGDIMPKLLDIGFDLETASDFLNSIPDADVVPKSEYIQQIAEVQGLREAIREIFEEVDHFILIPLCNKKYAELKKKYPEGEK